MANQGFISVKNWSEFQHYKDRNPPWIKLHRDLLRDYEFSCLQDASKLLLIELWLLASQLDNKIPNDPKWLNGQLPYNGKINLKPLIDSGYLILDSNALAECKQSAIVETETEAEADTWSNDFDRWWEIYPKKVGKKPTLAIWKRIKPDAALLITDTEKRLATDGQWLSGYIPNPQTYLNQERWQDDIQVAKTNGFAQPEKKEHISSTYKQFDPKADTESMLDTADPYADMRDM